MAIAHRPLTYDDLAAIQQAREGDRHELIGGVLYVTPSPVPVHEGTRFRAGRVIGNAVIPSGLGEVYLQVDVRLSPTDTVVPDLVFVSRERLHIVGETGIEGAPDLVLEVLSPSTRRRDLGEKLRLYERHQVREYWIADPVARTLAVRMLDGGSYRILPPEGGLRSSQVLPDLKIDVPALFAAADFA